MKLFGRAKLLMLGGAMAIGTLGGLATAAPSAHAALIQSAPSARTQAAGAVTLTSAGQPKGPSPALGGCGPLGCTVVRIPVLNLGAFVGCTNLTAWGWNFTTGGKVDITEYDNGAYLASYQVTAVDTGTYTGSGFIGWGHNLAGYTTNHHFSATAYDEDSGWSASADVQC